MVGVTPQVIGQLCNRGIIDPEKPARDMLLQYCAYIRNKAAGRLSENTGGSEQLDLVGERARLAKEQADRLEMQNAVTRREMAPVRLLEDALADAAAKTCGILDTIPGSIRMMNPEMPHAQIDAIAKTIAKARNTIAAARLGDISSDVSDADD